MRRSKGIRNSTRTGFSAGRRVLAATACALMASAGLATVGASVASAAATVQDLDHGTSANDLDQSLAGQGVSVSNVSFTGTNNGAGLFSGAAPSIGFDAGVVMGSGSVETTV